MQHFKPSDLPWRSLLVAFSLWITSTAGLQPVRVTFLTDCTMYSHWMSLGMQFSFKMSGQPGKITRVACCTDKEKDTYPEVFKNSVDTWLAPSMATHPTNGDSYAAYNKPEAVIDYLKHNTPEEEFLLVLDSDMTIRRPFLVEELEPKKGLAIGARYTYMIGVANELAPRHVPEVVPRNDTMAGPLGRRGDQVGGFFFIHRDDLKRMSTLWLKYTEDVRFDDMAWKYSGDVYATHAGSKPWISEMYGYAFGASKADVWHKWDIHSMIYPGYEPQGVPKVMHYGLHFDIGKNFSFDKHRGFNFDALVCPPWKLAESSPYASNRHGIHPQPPRVGELESRNEGTISLYYRDLLAIETVMTINAGLCDFHLSQCPESKQLFEICNDTWIRYLEVTQEMKIVEAKFSNGHCSDLHEKCSSWAERGECSTNREYMLDVCAKSCKSCDKLSAHITEGLAPASTDYPTKLEKLARSLGIEGAIATTTTAVTVSSTLASSSQEAVPALDTSSESLSVSPTATRLRHARAGQLTREAATQVSSATKAAASGLHTPARQNLKVHCYRMSLPIYEVKACLDAAKAGKEYTASSSARLLTGASLSSTTAIDPLLAHEQTMGQQEASVAPSLSLPSTPVCVLCLLLAAAALARVLRRLMCKPKSGMRTE